jgi:prepilin-type N-terminal cleavage/methylation domain-containing protein/prepilin-type processing-associated H-X9-DG protein
MNPPNSIKNQIPTEKKREGAFTLIELLVVIAIISILATLLLPVLTTAKGSAQSATCKNRLRQLGISLKLYVDDNDHHYPHQTYFSTFALSSGIEWMESLHPFHGIHFTNRQHHCPGYKHPILVPVPLRDGGFISNYSGSYGYNSYGVTINPWGFQQPHFGLGGHSSPNNPALPVRESQIKVPSQMLAMGDSRLVKWDAIHATWRSLPVRGDFWGGLTHMNIGGSDKVFPYPSRHGRNYNTLFCDGHVSGMNPAVLFNAGKSARLWNRDHEPHPEFWR